MDRPGDPDGSNDFFLPSRHLFSDESRGSFFFCECAQILLYFSFNDSLAVYKNTWMYCFLFNISGDE